MPIPLGILAVAGAGAGALPRAGYFAGGNVSAGEVTTVDKIAFSDDSRTTLATGLSRAAMYVSGLANSNVAGYVGPGESGGQFAADVDKFAFADDTRSIISAFFSPNRSAFLTAANSGTAGYFAGGFASSGAFWRDAVIKLTFASDAGSTLVAVLSSARGEGAGMANSGTAAYFGGGQTSPSGARTTAVDKLAFSNETMSTLGTGLGVALQVLSAFANSGTAGYFAGGSSSSGNVSTVYKYDFSNDTRSTPASTLTQATSDLAGMANSGTAGYAGGGLSGGSRQSLVDKWNFANDTVSALVGKLSSARQRLAGFANSGVL